VACTSVDLLDRQFDSVITLHYGYSSRMRGNNLINVHSSNGVNKKGVAVGVVSRSGL